MRGFATRFELLVAAVGALHIAGLPWRHLIANARLLTALEAGVEAEQRQLEARAIKKFLADPANTACSSRALSGNIGALFAKARDRSLPILLHRCYAPHAIGKISDAKENIREVAESLFPLRNPGPGTAMVRADGLPEGTAP